MSYLEPLALSQSQSQIPRRMWKEVHDKASGRNYYYHVETRQTQWNRPEEHLIVNKVPLTYNKEGTSTSSSKEREKEKEKHSHNARNSKTNIKTTTATANTSTSTALKLKNNNKDVQNTTSNTNKHSNSYTATTNGQKSSFSSSSNLHNNNNNNIPFSEKYTSYHELYASQTQQQQQSSSSSSNSHTHTHTQANTAINNTSQSTVSSNNIKQAAKTERYSNIGLSLDLSERNPSSSSSTPNPNTSTSSIGSSGMNHRTIGGGKTYGQLHDRHVDYIQQQQYQQHYHHQYQYQQPPHQQPSSSTSYPSHSLMKRQPELNAVKRESEGMENNSMHQSPKKKTIVNRHLKSESRHNNYNNHEIVEDTSLLLKKSGSLLSGERGTGNKAADQLLLTFSSMRQQYGNRFLSALLSVDALQQFQLLLNGYIAKDTLIHNEKSGEMEQETYISITSIFHCLQLLRGGINPGKSKSRAGDVH